MEKNEKKLFSDEELQNLKNALPGQYYPQFSKLWKARFKNENPPIRQSVYATLAGLSENDKILQVLIQVVEERNKLRAQLREVVNGHKQEAQAAN